MVDLAGASIPLSGQLRLQGRDDGYAVIGEALWIRGTSFGRQPTVTVAGRPARVWSRTGDGGLLVRVPAGAAAGRALVSVKQEHGEAALEVNVRRYAGVLAGGQLTWLDLGGEAPLVAGQVTVSGARFLRFSPDGRGAYLAGTDAVLCYELAAPQLPARVAQVAIGPGRILAVAAASSANRMVVVREADLLVFDLSAPLNPELRATHPLPPAARTGRVVRAELSPDGRLLALALGEGNRVALADTERLAAGDGALLGTVTLDRETRAPVVADLAFAHDGRTLWALAGETAESKALGPQPTRVFALRVGEGGRKLELARTVTVEVAGEPGRLSTGRVLPLASGAAVRLPPEKATVYLTAGVKGAPRAAVFSIGAQDAATELTATSGAGRSGGIDVTPEGRWLLAAAAEGTHLALLAAPADGRAGAVRSLTLAAGTGAEAAEVRIQP